MSEAYDVIVAGLGAMGSAALFQLASRNAKVMGLDPFNPPHAHGSSHGETRVIREAYFEHPIYVPLVQRAFALWEELQQASGERLYQRTGGLMIGGAQSAVFAGSLRSAVEHHLPHEVLNSAQISERFPEMRPDPNMSGLLEARAGILYPEKCIAAHLRLASQAGALIHTGEKLLQWEEDEAGVTVYTNRRSCRANKLIISSGAWLPSLVPDLRRLFQVERQVLLWFKSKDPSFFQPESFPVHLWEYETGRMFYGFPDFGSGVKIALHHQGQITHPATADREVRTEDVAAVRGLLETFLPEANGEFLRGTVCLYTNTPDEHFIIDHLPGHQNVIIASPCSGHGFKFSSAIGEILAHLALELPSGFNLNPFAFRRFFDAASAPESAPTAQ